MGREYTMGGQYPPCGYWLAVSALLVTAAINTKLYIL